MTGPQLFGRLPTGGRLPRGVSSEFFAVVNRGVRPLDWQRPCWCAPGEAGWRCCRVLVGEDVQPLNVGAVPRAIVRDILLDQGAQCVEREVFGLCFARRPSCAEWMVVGTVGMTTSW